MSEAVCFPKSGLHNMRPIDFAEKFANLCSAGLIYSKIWT